MEENKSKTSSEEDVASVHSESSVDETVDMSAFALPDLGVHEEEEDSPER